MTLTAAPPRLLTTQDLRPGTLPTNHHAPGCPHRHCPAGTLITACPTHHIRCRLRGLTNPTGDCGCGCGCPTTCVPPGGHLTLPRLHQAFAAAWAAVGQDRIAALYTNHPHHRRTAAEWAPYAVQGWQLRISTWHPPVSPRPAAPATDHQKEPRMRFMFMLLCALLAVTGLVSLVGWLYAGSAYSWQGVAYAIIAAVMLSTAAVLAMMLASTSPDREGATVTREATRRFRRRQRVMPPTQTPVS